MLFPVPDEDKNWHEDAILFLPENIQNQALLHTKTREYTWEYFTILDILKICESKNIVVLGGEVWLITNRSLELEGSLWYMEMVKQDLHQSLSEHSIKVTKDYLTKFPDPKNGTIRYSINFHDL
jgi:hypothetical protein